MKNLNEIFAKILNEYQKSGSLEAAISAINLSPEQEERMRRAFLTLDNIEANATSLRKAKEEGMSRKNWLAEQILSTAKTNNLSETQTENIFTELSNAALENINKEQQL